MMYYDEPYLRRSAAYYVEEVLLHARADIARVPIRAQSGEEDLRTNSIRQRIEILENQSRLLERESDPLDIGLVATTVMNAAQLALDLAVYTNEAMESLQRNHASISEALNPFWPTPQDIKNLQQASESAELVSWKESWERRRKAVAIALALLIILAVAPLPIRITIAGCALTTLLTMKVLLEAEINVATSVLRGRISVLQQLSQLSLFRVALALGGIVAGTRTASEDRPRPQA